MLGSMDRQFVYRYVFGSWENSHHLRMATQLLDMQLDAGATEAALERSFAIIRAMGAQLREQEEESAQLGVLVGVLVKMLREQGILDESVLRHRVDAELDAIDEATRKAEAQAKAAAQAKHDGLPQENCIRCKRRVLKTATTLTMDGAVCDDCARLGT